MPSQVYKALLSYFKADRPRDPHGLKRHSRKPPPMVLLDRMITSYLITSAVMGGPTLK